MANDLSQYVSLAGSPSSALTDGYVPGRPTESDHVLKLYTLQDAMEVLYLEFDVKPSTHARFARTACEKALNGIQNLNKWPFYERRASITTVASQSTGTVAYTASSRTLTLTGATWPANARYMSVIFGNNICRVANRVSDTELILRQEEAPASDVAAGTSYHIYRSLYLLPANYHAGSQFMPLNDSTWPDYKQPDDMVAATSHAFTPRANPHYYTIRQSEDYSGGWCVEFSPPPSTAVRYDFTYTSLPRPFTLFASGAAEYTTGTVSSSSTAVTGSGTAFTSSMIGCVLRSSFDGNPPTGREGSFADDNPYSEQRVITSVTDSTSLTVDQAFSANLSGASFSIGSPVDIEPHSMWGMFLAICEYEMANLLRRQDRFDRRKLMVAEIQNAKAATVRRRNLSEVGGGPYHWIDLNDGAM